MKPAPGRDDGGYASFALLSIAVLLLVVAGYLFLSSLLIENDCSLQGDPICAAALRRMWTAGGMAAVFVVITGVVGARFALRAGRGRRR